MIPIPPELAALVALIEEVSGNVVPERDAVRLAAIVEARVRAVGLPDQRAYVQLLRRDQDGEEWRTLLSLITVNESYLFRAPQQFDCLVNLVIPDLLSRRTSRTLRAWSAGCARGEEASTLAVVLAECPLLAGWDWQVVATDVDDEALADARRGVYGRRAVAKVPEPLLARYFVPRGEDFELSGRLRERIDYRHLNLVREPLDMPLRTFDFIFFRNVLIYFRPNSQQRVAEAVARTMHDDGYLFLGSSESLWHVYADLTPVDLGSCFCYRWTRDNPARPAASGEEASLLTAPLDEPTARTVPAPTTDSERRPKPDPAASRGAVRAAIVDALKSRSLELARGIIQDATKAFPEDAVVRAFDGLASDLAGEVDRAIRSYRAALYLDPNLYQARYLLARCMERIGWRNRAANELASVLATMAAPGSHELPGDDQLGLPRRAQIRAACGERGP